MRPDCSRFCSNYLWISAQTAQTSLLSLPDGAIAPGSESEQGAKREQERGKQEQAKREQRRDSEQRPIKRPHYARQSARLENSEPGSARKFAGPSAASRNAGAKTAGFHQIQGAPDFLLEAA